jgi:hypothetical protein
MESRTEFRAKYSGPLLRRVKRAPEAPSLPVSPQTESAASAGQKVDSGADSIPKSNKTEMILIWCGIILLLINVAITWISFREANAAKDTAKDTNRLTRQLLRGMGAAHIVTKVVPQGIGPDNRQIRVNFRNDGKVNALNVQGAATVCLISFPAGQKLTCKTIPVSKPQLGFEGDEITLEFDGIVGDGDITLLENNRATVQYSSAFHFNDGFDDWIDGSSCQLYFVRHFLSTDSVQERNWASCDVGKILLSNEVKRRSEQ